MIEELISRGFNARNVAHVKHLLSKSYAEHMALNAFYDGVVDAVDAVVEAYVGLFGDFDPAKVSMRPAEVDVGDIQAFLGDEAEWIETNRDTIANGSETVGALIDDLCAVYVKAVYMLEMK